MAGSKKKKTTFLGNGTYGCVFTPPLECKDKTQGVTKPKHVGKVFLDKHAFQDEHKSCRNMMQADPSSEFTVPIASTCIVKQTTLPKDEQVPPMCSSFKGSEHQIIYPNHGDDLLHFAKKHRGKPKAFFKLVKAFAPVFKGLQTLERAEIVHSDIKPANMLYNPGKNSIVLIDYGLVTPFQDIMGPDHNSLKDAEYMYFPPEFKLVIAKQTQKTMAAALDAAHRGKSLEFFDTFNVDTHKELLRLLNARDILKMPNKIDVYSLGISIAEIMMLMVPNGVSLTRIDKMKLLLVKNMIRDMIRLNPQERASPQEIAKIYRNVANIL
jgi:hypothetical protein